MLVDSGIVVWVRDGAVTLERGLDGLLEHGDAATYVGYWLVWQRCGDARLTTIMYVCAAAT